MILHRAPLPSPSVVNTLPFPPRETPCWWLQVLTSLAFLHGLGLIHCDLKPENIMIADFDAPRVKLIDLGSSCFRHDRLATYVQSRAYRAPEVILQAGYDARIDLWSLGAILVELVTGAVLFAVRTPTSTSYAFSNYTLPERGCMLGRGDPLSRVVIPLLDRSK
jgi:serine/threonine protein kinase